MKKIVAMVLMAAMIFCIAGCGKTDEIANPVSNTVSPVENNTASVQTEATTINNKYYSLREIALS